MQVRVLLLFFVLPSFIFCHNSSCSACIICVVWPVCVCLCPHEHLYPHFCLHVALCLARVCAFIALYAPPFTVTCSSFPSHCSASLLKKGVFSRNLQEVFVTHWAEGKANSEMHKHRMCYFFVWALAVCLTPCVVYQKAETGNLPLSAHVFSHFVVLNLVS